MICIDCLKANGKIQSLSIVGHANFAKRGKDIVCSAVSAIIFGGLNALENPESFKINIDEDKGIITIESKDNVSMHDYDVLNTILIQLKTVEETANKNVKIVEKGC